MSRQVDHWQKDADETVTQTLNWSADLNGSTISTVTWGIPAGLTQSATSNTTTTASLRYGGGMPGVTYRIDCTVATAANDVLEVHVLTTIDD